MEEALYRIQTAIYITIFEIIDGKRDDHEDLIAEYKELRKVENALIKAYTHQYNILEIAEETEGFYWSKYELCFMEESEHMNLARMLNLYVDLDKSIAHSFIGEESTIDFVKRDMDVSEKTAAEIIKLSLEAQENYFKKLLIQILKGISKIKKQFFEDVDLAEITYYLTNLIYLFPSFLEKELLTANFDIDSLNCDLQVLDKIFFKRRIETVDAQVGEQLFELVTSFDSYLSFADTEGHVALDNLNAILRVTNVNTFCGWEVMKMQMHLVIRMLDERRSDLLLRQLGNISNPCGKKLIEEVIEEIRSQKKLLWEQ